MEAVSVSWMRASCGLRPLGVLRSGETESRRPVRLRIRATNTRERVVEFENGDEGKARYAGDHPLAKFVNKIIAIKPVYNVLKFGAKNVMISTAEKNGIPWKEMVAEMKASDVYTEKEKLENTAMIYPDYYKKAFHGYESGNLSWEAAFEVDPATLALWKRTHPKIETWQKASELTRSKWLETIRLHHADFSGGLTMTSILDMGCSTASSTRYIADHYPTAQVTGLDLSPYFLAVAQYRERQAAARGESRPKPIQFLHANAEETELPSNSFDMVSLAYLIHECPQTAVRNVLREAHRLLRPGGTVSLSEQSPKSKAIQKLHPALWTMMKSTEPWLDDFYRLDLEAELIDSGFTNYRSILTDPRHFTCTATAVK